MRTGIKFLQAYAKAYDEREKQRLSLKSGKEQEIVAVDNKLAPLDPVEFYGQFLNLYVLARYPTKFLDAARKDGIIFTPEPGRPWLLRTKIGFQNVALVICRDLPFERRYYEWLVFAPSDGKRWKTFIQRLEEEGEKKLLDIAARLRPKEFAVTKATVDDIWEDMRAEGVLTPEVEAHMAQETHEAIEGMLGMLEDIEPFVIGLFFDRMTDAQASRVVNSPSILTLATFLRHFEQPQYERALSLINSAAKW
jgi:hypothetical protein